MPKRFFRYRSVNGWGLIEDTRDHELRSYVDGHLRSFRYQHRIEQRPERQLEWEVRPCERAWDVFFKRLNQLGVWDWRNLDIEPVVDQGHFRLQLRDGANELDISGCGFLPSTDAFEAAIAELYSGVVARTYRVSRIDRSNLHDALHRPIASIEVDHPKNPGNCCVAKIVSTSGCGLTAIIWERRLP